MDSEDQAAFQELEADLAALAEEDDSDDEMDGGEAKRRFRNMGSASLDGCVGVGLGGRGG